MTYIRIDPHRDLQPFIETLWLQENPSPVDGTSPTRIVPSCGAELVICYGAPFEQVDGSPKMVMPMALVAGQRMHGIAVRATGRTGMVIARCHPWAVRALLGSTPEELADRHAALEEIDQGELARCLYERVAEAGSSNEKISLVEDYLQQVFASVTPDPLVVKSVQRINASWGRVGVEALAQELSISRRQLHRRFVGAVGIGVKRFARLVRFQKALGCLRAGLPWGEAVWRCGYVDQAHLITELKTFMGQTPGAICRQRTTPLMRYFNEPDLRRLNTTVYL